MRDREQAVQIVQDHVVPRLAHASAAEAGKVRDVVERALDSYEAQPLVVTDDTVERAADAYLDAYMNRRQPDLIDVDLVAMRAALEAALNPQQSPS